MLSKEKGVGDCLEAVRLVRDRGRDFVMSFAGPGDVADWTARARALGVADAVRFLGVVSHEEVRERMRAHDFVIVPSRHSYAEGLPNTIYEGLASRSALLMSDHPAFAGRLVPEQQCLVFAASDPGSLADAIVRLCEDSDLYSRLSENAEAALADLYVGVEWIDLVNMFLHDPRDETHWVAAHSLAGCAADQASTCGAGLPALGSGGSPRPRGPAVRRPWAVQVE